MLLTILLKVFSFFDIFTTTQKISVIKNSMFDFIGNLYYLFYKFPLKIF